MVKNNHLQLFIKIHTCFGICTISHQNPFSIFFSFLHKKRRTKRKFAIAVFHHIHKFGSLKHRIDIVAKKQVLFSTFSRKFLHFIHYSATPIFGRTSRKFLIFYLLILIIQNHHTRFFSFHLYRSKILIMVRIFDQLPSKHPKSTI